MKLKDKRNIYEKPIKKDSYQKRCIKSKEGLNFDQFLDLDTESRDYLDDDGKVNKYSKY